MRYDEAVKIGADALQPFRGGMGEKRREHAAKRVLDAIGYRQMQRRLDWFEQEVLIRFHLDHVPEFDNHTLGKVFGDIRQLQEALDTMAKAAFEYWKERNQARTDVLKLRQGWKEWCTKPEPGARSGSTTMDAAMDATEHYEEH
jgi:hypothetical protein